MLKPVLWSGRHYTVSVERRWQALFDMVTVFEIRKPRMTTVLPRGAGVHIGSLYELVDGARDYFRTGSDWWNYSTRLCDDYCEFFVLENPRDGNPFNVRHNQYLNDRYAVQNAAKAARGYYGPTEWKLT